MAYWEEHRPKMLELAINESSEFQLGQAKTYIMLQKQYITYLEEELNEVYDDIEALDIKGDE